MQTSRSYDCSDRNRSLREEREALLTVGRWLLALLRQAPSADAERARLQLDLDRELLSTFRDGLCRHFLREEFPPAGSPRPAASWFEELAAQHDGLLANIDALRDSLLHDEAEQSELLVLRFERFLQRLRRHEADEQEPEW